MNMAFVFVKLFPEYVVCSLLVHPGSSDVTKSHVLHHKTLATTLCLLYSVRYSTFT